MRFSKVIILYCLILFFIPGSFKYLYSDDGWPTYFTYYYGDSLNPIENMFKDEKLSRCFNYGYYGDNTDKKYNPINEKNRDDILQKLTENSNNVVLDALNQVKNCSVFNDLFGENAEKFLSKMRNRFTFTNNLPNLAYGTVSDWGIFVKDRYLQYFLYHLGEQAREIDNGQRTDFDLTTEHFNYGMGGKATIPIATTVAHELMHAASGFNGGVILCLAQQYDLHSMKPLLFSLPPVFSPAYHVQV